MTASRALSLPLVCWLTSTVLIACGEAQAEAPKRADTGACDVPSRAAFVDAETGFSTARVYDADREVVCFEPALSAMVSSDGTMVADWTASDNALTWQRSPVAFGVLFGSEQGERRAYFTETATGTICDLRISGPDELMIFPTSEPPPQQ